MATAIKYRCKCGFETEDKKEIRAHYLKMGRKEPGIHGSSTGARHSRVNLPPDKVAQMEKAIVEATGVRMNEPVKQPEAKPDTKKTLKFNIKKTFMLLGGIALAPAGFWLFSIYARDIKNMPMGIGSVLLLITSAVLVWMAFKGKDSFVAKPLKAKAGVINSLIIHPDLIEFKQMDDIPDWQPRKCRNDGKLYYVYIDRDSKLERFVLPDTIYRDPREVANYLNIPAHRALAQQEATFLEKISPAVLLLGIIAVGIIWVATTPQVPA